MGTVQTKEQHRLAKLEQEKAKNPFKDETPSPKKEEFAKETSPKSVSLVSYNPDQKLIDSYQSNLSKFVNIGVFGGSLNDEKSIEIQKSNQAKSHFMRPENMEKFKK